MGKTEKPILFAKMLKMKMLPFFEDMHKAVLSEN